jgi:hypothetical protein
MESMQVGERATSRCVWGRAARFVLVFSATTIWLCSLGIAPVAAASPHASLLGSQAGCLVCHASTGVQLQTPGDLGVLTDPVDAEVCVSCHIGGTADAPKVYAGDPNHYSMQDGFGHNGGTVTCLSCHTIHGTAVGNPALAGHLLKVLDYQPEAVKESNPETAPHDQALSAWCTGCHKRWPVLIERGGAKFYSDHNFSAAAGSSWRDCRSCLDCHAASGFPHYTPGADAGLVGAASAEETRTGVADRDAAGVCMGCHRSGSGDDAQGIGITY